MYSSEERRRLCDDDEPSTGVKDIQHIVASELHARWE